MSDYQESHCCDYWLDRMRGEICEILLHILRISIQSTHGGATYILQAPSRHNGIIASDEEACDHPEESHVFPCAALSHPIVCPCRVGCTVSAYYELAHHARNAQYEHAHQIDDDEHSTTILACHVWEPPDVAQSDGRARCGKHDPQFTSEINSFSCFRHISWSFEKPFAKL